MATITTGTTWTGDTGRTWTSIGTLTLGFLTAAMPTITVECGFGDDPFTASPTWTDITGYVTERTRMTRGRQHELARIEAGTLDVVLTSTDDRFNPENTASPYYPNLKPLVPIRVTAVDPNDATVHVLWRGYVQGWPQTWTLNGKQSRVPLRCVDALGLFARIPITDWDTAVLADSPVAFWRFGTESVLTDESGNGNDGTFVGTPTDTVSSSTQGLLGYDTDGTADRYLQFATSDSIETFTDPAALRIDGDLSIELWVRPSTAASTQDILQCWSSSGNPLLYGIHCNSGTTTRNVAYRQSAGLPIVTLVTQNVNEWVHIVVTRTAAGKMVGYINGVAIVEALLPPVTATGSEVLKIGDGVNGNFDGGISELAIYTKILTPGRIAAHYNSRSMFGGGETVDNVVTSILTLAGWPSALTATKGTVTTDAAIPSDTINETLASLLRRITDAQEYPLFVDRDGTFTVMTRDYQAASKNTPSFTIGDSDGEYGYKFLNVPNDDTQIRTVWRVTPVGGVVEEATDTTARTTFGPREKTISNALIADNDVGGTGSQALSLARAQSGLSKSKDATFRIEQVVIDPLSQADYWQHILPLDITDRIAIHRTPPGGSLQTHEAYVEHLTHEFTVGKTWVTTLRLSPASLQDQWILGDAVMSLLGETSKLGW